MKVLLASLASALLVTPTLFAQGVLAPTDAPGPLMKSLDQIEPRIPISSLPSNITTSGSYYFTGNIEFTATSGSAITISANDVTLDLGGFTLSSTAAVTGKAIEIFSACGVTVKNGYIAGNTTVVVSGSPSTWTTTLAGFDIGIRDYATGSRYQELGIRGCRTYGLYSSGKNTVIDRIFVHANGTSGISAEFSSISNCTATSNGGAGISAVSGSVSNSIASYNATYGIFAHAGSVTNVAASSNGSTGIYAIFSSVTGSTAKGNGSAGIFAFQGSVTSSTARSNTSYGIDASYGSVTSSTSSYNGNSGIYADFGSVNNSIALNNTGIGINAFSGSVTNSTAASNANTGISAPYGSVTSSTSYSNTGFGIYAEAGSVTSSTARDNTSIDLYATDAVVAFCKAGTKNITGSIGTGNLTNP